MFATVNGTNLFFDIEGSLLELRGTEVKPRPVCFVLHGGPGLDHTGFRPWLSPLADLVQLVYIDLRGQGRSGEVPLETCTINQMADDLEQLRQYLGVERPLILGHSFGGFVALTYAVRYPENYSGLILVDTAAKLDAESAMATAQRMLQDRPEVMQAVLGAFTGQIKTEEQMRTWWKEVTPLYMQHYDPIITTLMFDRMLMKADVMNHVLGGDEMANYDLTDRLETIKYPVLAICGESDWITPVNSSWTIAQRVALGKLVVLQNAGHFSYLEQSARFMQATREFVLFEVQKQ
jgi:proline iminopeptidase